MILTTINVGYMWEGRNKSRGTGGTRPRWLKRTCMQRVKGSALRWEVKDTAICGDQKAEGSSPLGKLSGEPARRRRAGDESKDIFKIQWITEAKLQRLELSFPKGRRGDGPRWPQQRASKEPFSRYKGKGWGNLCWASFHVPVGLLGGSQAHLTYSAQPCSYGCHWPHFKMRKLEVSKGMILGQ